MLTPCDPPYLVPDPDNADTIDINKERLSVATWGKCNETKFNGLVDYIKALASKTSR